MPAQIAGRRRMREAAPRSVPAMRLPANPSRSFGASLPIQSVCGWAHQTKIASNAFACSRIGGHLRSICETLRSSLPQMKSGTAAHNILHEA